MGRVLNSLKERKTGKLRHSRKISGLLSFSLRENRPMDSVLIPPVQLVYSILQTTGMRFAEAKKICINSIEVNNTISIPETKHGKIHTYILTDFQIVQIFALNLKFPFLDFPSYRSVYNFALNHGNCDTTIYAKQNRSILSGLRKIKIRNLVQNSEPAKRLTKIFGWKSPASIGYYL